MEKIQNFSEEMNLDELLNELNNFEESLNEFEEQIDRFIDMFEQAISEQKIDEVIKKLGLEKKGYRLITNDGLNANQEVPHFHVHILGGQNLGGLK